MSPQPAGWSAHTNAARAEDLDWMARTGETTTGAARRLGLRLEALEKWCDRHQRRDLWNRLQANQNAHVA